ncbi:MAG: hypothetical protein IPL89_04735 [Acidobacteria bacterium]|nr:hypothetical protein [Acidobacteriota bacterium]
MTSARATAFTCPRCAGRLPVASSAHLDCPSCGSALAIYVPGAAIREAVVPTKTAAEAAVAAVAFFSRHEVPRAFARLAPDPPVLLWAAAAETWRTRAAGGAVSETVQVALAAPVPGLALEKADLAAALAGGTREPFDPARLQRAGFVFDPVKGPDALFDAPAGLLEERFGVVYVPFWIVRKRFRRGLYEALVDASSGALLHARAPAARTRRLLEAALLVYALAAALAMPLRGWGKIAQGLLNLDELGVFLLFLIPTGLVLLAAWAWNRLRFRYEIDGDAAIATLRPINKPERTLLERIAATVLKGTMWIAGKLF